jgi:hypothetical protein
LAGLTNKRENDFTSAGGVGEFRAGKNCLGGTLRTALRLFSRVTLRWRHGGEAPAEKGARFD